MDVLDDCIRSEEKKYCCTCKWYAEFEGVCCNGDSEYRGDFRNLDDTCVCWENIEEKDRWDNKQVWNGLIAQGHQIVTALDVIEAVLLGGEKDRIIDEINKMSGFNSENIEEVENNLEDVTKN